MEEYRKKLGLAGIVMGMIMIFPDEYFSLLSHSYLVGTFQFIMFLILKKMAFPQLSLAKSFLFNGVNLLNFPLLSPLLLEG